MRSPRGGCCSRPPSSRLSRCDLPLPPSQCCRPISSGRTSPIASIVSQLRRAVAVWHGYAWVLGMGLSTALYMEHCYGAVAQIYIIHKYTCIARGTSRLCHQHFFQPYCIIALTHLAYSHIVFCYFTVDHMGRLHRRLHPHGLAGRLHRPDQRRSICTLRRIQSL